MNEIYYKIKFIKADRFVVDTDFDWANNYELDDELEYKSEDKNHVLWMANQLIEQYERANFLVPKMVLFQFRDKLRKY